MRNNLEKLCPVKPVKVAPDILATVVDAMKVVRIIPITGLKPPIFLTWANNVLNHIMNLPGSVMHIVFDRYSEEGDLSRPSKNRYNSVGECRHVSSFSQKLPPSKDAWTDYLTNDGNKHQLTSLLTNYIMSGSYNLRCPVYVTKYGKCMFKDRDG